MCLSCVCGAQWLAELEDPECPLYKDAAGKITAPKLKQRFLQDFVQDKQPLLNRIDFC